MQNLLRNLVLILALLTVLTGCTSPSEEAKIKDLVNKNADYLNEEDLDGYISTLNLPSSELEEQKDLLSQIFQIYDLNIEIESIDIEEIKDDSAKTRIVQTTKKIDGEKPFQDNRLELRHTLTKIEDEWKISNTEILNTEYLNN